jgi:hypothetical protein
MRRRRPDVDADRAEPQPLGGHVPFVATVIVLTMRVRLGQSVVRRGP